MEFKFNDGGRAKAGYKGKAGDCVCRAIAIATGLPYQTVYDELQFAIEEFATGRSKAAKRAARGKGQRGTTPRNGVHKKVYHKYLLGMGFEWIPTMFVGSGCTVHLDEKELPNGTLIVRLSKHLTTVIDGVINDTYNCADRGVTVYGNDYPKDLLPKGSYKMENGNGFAHKSQRCVYGYYKMKTA